MKRLFSSLLLFSALCAMPAVLAPAIAEDDMDAARSSVPYTSYKDCLRLYKLTPDKLFLLALSSVNANKYEILEMQSRNGYIIFQEKNREYLLTVMKKDKYFTYLKLAPCDNNYYFSPQIPYKIFNYVDLNFNAEVKELKF